MWLHYIILFAIYLLYNMPYFLDNYSLQESDLGSCSVLILILSARSNYEKRQAIRKTWLEASRQSKNICYSFAIGSECIVPPGDRIDKYGCLELMDHTADLNPKNEFISNSFHEKELPSDYEPPHAGSAWYTGVGFKVLNPVILKRVGVHIKVMPSHGSSLQLMLRNARSEVFSVEVTKQSCSSINDGFCFQQFKKKEFHLPTLYEAEVFIRRGSNRSIDIDYHAPYVDCKWVNASAVLYSFGKVNDIIEPFDPTRCSLISLIFEVSDADSLSSHFLTKSFRRQSHEIFMNQSNATIAKEIREHRDIAYLPNVVDVYRNLPTKLLQSLIWSEHRYHNLEFMLKVDDDSYVNMKRLQHLVRSLSSNATPSIFGGFLHHAGTNLFGKWAEVEYSSMTYPSFPTGAGYLLTGNLVGLLVEASPFLKPFQGEDVSVAIWIEGLTGASKDPSWLRVHRVEIKCWLSVPKCPDFFIKQQLTPEMMYKLHYNL